MRWKPRRNGGNSTQTRYHQSVESRDRDGHGRGISGHHSWAKSRGGGNKTGATSHAPKEWGSHARKEEEHLTGLAKRAEVDAIREGLAEFDGDDWEAYQASLDDLSDELFDYSAFSSLVTFNGQDIYDYDDDDYYDYLYDDDECPHCGRRY